MEFYCLYARTSKPETPECEVCFCILLSPFLFSFPFHLFFFLVTSRERCFSLPLLEWRKISSCIKVAGAKILRFVFFLPPLPSPALLTSIYRSLLLGEGR